MAEGREEGIEARGPGRGAGRAEEMIVKEPVNPLIKYSKPVSSLTSVGRSRSRRRDFTTGMSPARGRRKEVKKEGSVWGREGIKGSFFLHELRKKGTGP